VDFRNAIIVMTSNVGADTIKRGSQLGFVVPREEDESQAADYDEMRKKVMEQLRRAFRPEFLNRVSATIVFRSLTREEITAIVDLELNKVRERLAEHALVLEMTDAAKQLLAEKGYDPEFGARPLRRVITNMVEDRLSDGILAGTFKLGSTIRIDAQDGELTFNPIENEPAPVLDVSAAAASPEAN
jgi:ATP-dependent Clp protease ATP-binding subunit ClpC